MTSKELREWLEGRGVAVVGTRTDKRTGRVSAWSCFFYGEGRAHCFAHPRGSPYVYGTHVDDRGREIPAGSWAVDHQDPIPKSE